MDFATIAGRAKAMMNYANLNQESWLLLCKEAFQRATNLDKVAIINIDGELKTRSEDFGEKNLNSAGSFEHLVKQAWSRLVKMKKLGITKLVECLLVTHVTVMDWYHMYNPKTKWVTEMRNVAWLK